MLRIVVAARMTPLLIAQIVLTLFVFVMLLNSAAVMVYVERKVAALLQQRLGPYLVGPQGLLQPLADVIKLMFKEELRPARGRSAAVRARADHLGDRRVRRVRGGAVRRRDDALRPARRADAAAGGRRQRRGAGHLRHRVDERLRHRARRLELEQQVLAARRPALVGADDQLRAVLRPGARRRAAASPTRCRSPTSSTRRRAPGSGSSRAGSCSCSRSASSST